MPQDAERPGAFGPGDAALRSPVFFFAPPRRRGASRRGPAALRVARVPATAACEVVHPALLGAGALVFDGERAPELVSPVFFVDATSEALDALSRRDEAAAVTLGVTRPAAVVPAAPTPESAHPACLGRRVLAYDGFREVCRYAFPA